MSQALHIVCPHCAAINRVPQDRLAQAPKCGNCHAELFTGQPAVLNGTSLERHVRRNDIPTLVDFWAPWCGPCKVMAPELERATRELEPAVRVAKLDTQAEPVPAGELDIRAIPTLILFADGREQARRSGAIGAGDIVTWVRAQRST